ncbi:hypothetical protein TRSC58_07266 [Trypanosoma rangeli SC58]|uniref:Uncharacterized protein n=1 Tax=Trypanosoma rangeli SC58 TaxID=429131 RepID=A0A061ITM1_TRYRA|nr:hypothetical protein TRSC58_07266 [Trypanosoma rangeli SC58]
MSHTCLYVQLCLQLLYAVSFFFLLWFLAKYGRKAWLFFVCFIHPLLSHVLRSFFFFCFFSREQCFIVIIVF